MIRLDSGTNITKIWGHLKALTFSLHTVVHFLLQNQISKLLLIAKFPLSNGPNLKLYFISLLSSPENYHQRVQAGDLSTHLSRPLLPTRPLLLQDVQHPTIFLFTTNLSPIPLAVLKNPLLHHLTSHEQTEIFWSAKKSLRQGNTKAYLKWKKWGL